MILDNVLQSALFNTLCRKGTVLVVPLLLLLAAPNTSFSNNTSPEYAVKAAYIFNILRFVESTDESWLDEVDEINICMLGENKFSHHLKPIETRYIQGKPLLITERRYLKGLQNCQLVFVGNKDVYPPEDLSKILGDKKIVVLGDDLDFVKDGGMFSFYLENKKVRLGFNKTALDRSTLKVSSLLLELCTAFGDTE